MRVVGIQTTFVGEHLLRGVLLGSGDPGSPFVMYWDFLGMRHGPYTLVAAISCHDAPAQLRVKPHLHRKNKNKKVRGSACAMVLTTATAE